ncbi:hypothetical protein VTK73DRAFT_8788 [Phialemonium thermophilum]|uniref:FAD dependent oxidoreductase domain-containing protein n=1 Tax=Phialemonium thermophilum TaxID=223376 RepID=A0ABR3XNM2_9PEZI
MTTQTQFSAPSSILIVGSGVFGLTTAYALAHRPAFAQTSITVVDRAESDSTEDGNAFPARDAASVDTSRIIRSDYADPAYAALAAEAQRHWRRASRPEDLGAEGRYTESGLVLVADAAPADPSPVSGVAPPVHQEKAKKSGMEYVRASWENVRALSAHDPQFAGRIRELPDAAAIREAVGTGGSSGSWGYVNETAGWADAAKSMAWLYERVRRTGRVSFVRGTVTRLVSNYDDGSSATVTGIELSDDRTLSADLVMLATGAWTASLLDLGGQAVATGQVLAYMDITEEEQEKLARMPTLLNLSTGLFIITPSNRILKIARHGYGYLNPTAFSTAPLNSPPSTAKESSQRRSVSFPATSVSDPTLSIPEEGAAALRQALREMVPFPNLHDRPFTRTRLCWYSDTPTADFIVSYHPRVRGLFVATGDSGHGFKFLPVLGDKIVDVLEGHCPPEFREKWAWKDAKPEGRLDEQQIFTEDGSRGGVPGLILENELRKASD